ncbi:DNA topology modulation protein [Paenibacillus sp. PL91]|uniref:DNA topology modulation protein n=1 Tax=Paenibacillus sp. PL91 TaxID=2729538 RepID=UPI00145C5FD5|nr:DNA topology modulation protein [Paenibacillus sp. PL91]MBC9199350.1 DNA topology modulation protein [Paenibacillus sp. PL91]
MKKIILIGSGGSGKSTLARTIGKILLINVYHLDAIFWKPGWVATPKDEQKKVQEKLINHERWIIDGNYGGTIDIRLNAADTIIFIDLSRWICLFRVLKRRFQYRNKKRDDLAEGCEERINFQFLKWVWDYSIEQKPKIMEQLRNHSPDKRVIILKSPKEVKQFITNMKLLNKQ